MSIVQEERAAVGDASYTRDKCHGSTGLYAAEDELVFSPCLFMLIYL